MLVDGNSASLPAAPLQSPTTKGGVQRLTEANAEGVADLFLRVFRPGIPADRQGIVKYITELALTSPSYKLETGSMIYAQPDGRVRSALLSVPMRFVAFDKVLDGRLLCVYMTDADKETAGAADLILSCVPSGSTLHSATVHRRSAIRS